jgi:hypothetical protein
MHTLGLVILIVNICQFCFIILQYGVYSRLYLSHSNILSVCAQRTIGPCEIRIVVEDLGLNYSSNFFWFQLYFLSWNTSQQPKTCWDYNSIQLQLFNQMNKWITKEHELSLWVQIGYLGKFDFIIFFMQHVNLWTLFLGAANIFYWFIWLGERKKVNKYSLDAYPVLMM